MKIKKNYCCLLAANQVDVIASQARNSTTCHTIHSVVSKRHKTEVACVKLLKVDHLKCI